MLVVIGVALVVVGFALRPNPLGVVTDLLRGLFPLKIFNAFGDGFAAGRSVTLFVIVLPAIGLLERFGLRERARRIIAGLTAFAVPLLGRNILLAST